MSTRVASVCRQIGDLSHQPPGRALGEAVAGGVNRLAGYDGYCLLGLDPISGARSFQFACNGLEDARALAFNEHVQRDANRYVELARTGRPVGVLGSGEPHDRRSFRLHEILRPFGFRSELRLAIGTGVRLWGALVLFRDERSHPFTQRERDDIAMLVQPMGEALRAHVVSGITTHGPTLATGVALLDRQNELVAITAEVDAWLHQVMPGGTDETSLDDLKRVLYDVADLARAGRTGVTRIRTYSGRWLVVEGSRVEHGTADVAVTLRAADPDTVLPAMAEWCRFTPRQTQVTRRLARGHSYKRIGRDLGITQMTVNDHVKAIFAKADAHSREDLLARLT